MPGLQNLLEELLVLSPQWKLENACSDTSEAISSSKTNQLQQEGSKAERPSFATSFLRGCHQKLLSTAHNQQDSQDSSSGAAPDSICSNSRQVDMKTSHNKAPHQALHPCFGSCPGWYWIYKEAKLFNYFPYVLSTNAKLSDLMQSFYPFLINLCVRGEVQTLSQSSACDTISPAPFANCSPAHVSSTFVENQMAVTAWLYFLGLCSREHKRMLTCVSGFVPVPYMNNS